MNSEFERRQIRQIRVIRRYCRTYRLTFQVGAMRFIEQGLAEQWAAWYEGVLENHSYNHSTVHGGVGLRHRNVVAV